VPSASRSDLAALLTGVAQGNPLPADGGVTVVEPPDARSAGVFAFTAHHVVAAPVDPGWVRSVLPPDELSAPLAPSFLLALAARAGRRLDNLDAVLVAQPGPASTLALSSGAGHPRGEHRTGAQVWLAEGGVLVLGRGVAGRLEVAVEVDQPGRGLGRALFAAARGLAREPLWAQVAPGNAASMRALLAAGFTPVGAEVLLV
jgi:GNAT superfamily N-acetyltransferase